MTLKTDFDGFPPFERLAAKVGREAALDCAIHLGQLAQILEGSRQRNAREAAETTPNDKAPIRTRARAAKAPPKTPTT